MFAFDSMLSRTLTFLFPNDCFDELLVRHNFLHEECPGLVLSRFLGLGVTAGSAMVMMPQVLKMQTARSGAGVSLAAMLLSLLACVGTTAYSYQQQFVFSQYGDAVLLAVQLIIIVVQMLCFSGRMLESVVFVLSMAVLTMSIFYGLVPGYILALLQTAVIPITVFAKGIQIQTNYSNQSTGQLSIISVSLQFGGCLARIFTSMKETDDRLVVLTFVVAALLNGIIFAQMLIYWGRKPARKME